MACDSGLLESIDTEQWIVIKLFRVTQFTKRTISNPKKKEKGSHPAIFFFHHHIFDFIDFSLFY